MEVVNDKHLRISVSNGDLHQHLVSCTPKNGSLNGGMPSIVADSLHCSISLGKCGHAAKWSSPL